MAILYYISTIFASSTSHPRAPAQRYPDRIAFMGISSVTMAAESRCSR